MFQQVPSDPSIVPPTYPALPLISETAGAVWAINESAPPNTRRRVKMGNAFGLPKTGLRNSGLIPRFAFKQK